MRTDDFPKNVTGSVKFTLFTKVLNFKFKGLINLAFEGGIHVSVTESDNTLNFSSKSYNDFKIDEFLKEFFSKLQDFEVEE
jgi:secreted Zn-dependent insulinase-like peptidase